MVVIFIVGTAGSGKSVLTGTLNEWLRVQKQKSVTVNLDPGVMNLPYAPDIDIRDEMVRLTLTTPDVGGITQKDLDLAQRIDFATSAR